MPWMSRCIHRLSLRAHDQVRGRRHRRVRPLDLSRRPVSPGLGAEQARAHRLHAGLHASRRRGVRPDAGGQAGSRASKGARALLLQEIREQPAALTRLLEHRDEYAAVARLARERGVSIVRLVGHGSSDNAASYGVYAFGLLPGWTAFRDSISLSVYYGAEVDLRDSCVVALSQSGRTPGRPRVRRASPGSRRLHDRAHERERLAAG